MLEGLARWMPGWPWGPGSNRAFTVTDPTGPGHKALLYLVAASTGGPAESGCRCGPCVTTYNSPCVRGRLASFMTAQERSKVFFRARVGGSRGYALFWL